VDSLRQAASCLGLKGNVSIVRDFFGFRRGVLPPDPEGELVEISLRRQLRLLEGRIIHVNVIAVGADQFSDDDRIELDYCIFRLRNIYSQVSLGVGRVEHHNISTTAANGLDNPTTFADVKELREQFTIPNDGIDVFVPHNWNVTTSSGQVVSGLTPAEPACEKGGKDDASSLGLFGSLQTARTFAHEIGHYLGLDHPENLPDNLMTPSSDADDIRDSVELTSSQGATMRKHCTARDGC
jgi:hypothetical protein